MKTQNLSAILSIVFMALLGICSTSAFAQKNIIWKGGAPGHETDWHYAKNWSSHTVPNEFSDVIIPDVSTTTGSLPVIRAGKVEVNALFVYPNAGLTVGQKAELLIMEAMGDKSTQNIEVAGRLYFHDNEKNEIVLAPQTKAARRH